MGERAEDGLSDAERPAEAPIEIAGLRRGVAEKGGGRPLERLAHLGSWRC